MLTTELIEHILSTIPQRTVGVLGDLFLDRYLDIDPALDELSVETGKIAYQVARVRSYPGAAGTVINNLAALGVGRIYPIAFIGDDGEGYELRQALNRLRKDLEEQAPGFWDRWIRNDGHGSYCLAVPSDSITYNAESMAAHPELLGLLRS